MSHLHSFSHAYFKVGLLCKIAKLKKMTDYYYYYYELAQFRRAVRLLRWRSNFKSFNFQQCCIDTTDSRKGGHINLEPKRQREEIKNILSTISYKFYLLALKTWGTNTTSAIVIYNSCLGNGLLATRALTSSPTQYLPAVFCNSCSSPTNHTYTDKYSNCTGPEYYYNSAFIFAAIFQNNGDIMHILHGTLNWKDKVKYLWILSQSNNDPIPFSCLHQHTAAPLDSGGQVGNMVISVRLLNHSHH